MCGRHWLIHLLGLTFCCNLAEGLDQCVTSGTPWSHMCEDVCKADDRSGIFYRELQNCTQSRLPSNIDAKWFSTSMGSVKFIGSSSLRTVPQHSLSGLKAESISFTSTQLTFQSFAFENATISYLEFKGIDDLTLRRNLLTGSIVKKILMQDISRLELPSGLFSGVQGLEMISLIRCNLDALPRGIFSGVTTLKKIAIGGNDHLVTLSSGVFRDLDILEHLDLKANGLVVLPEDLFLGLHKLKVLELDLNSIISLPQDLFASLWNLKTLHVENNAISCWPMFIFRELKAIEKMVIYQPSLPLRGYCRQSLRNINPREVDTLNAKVDPCVEACKFRKENRSCRCDTHEGCFKTCPVVIKADCVNEVTRIDDVTKSTGKNRANVGLIIGCTLGVGALVNVVAIYIMRTKFRKVGNAPAKSAEGEDEGNEEKVSGTISKKGEGEGLTDTISGIISMEGDVSQAN